MCKRLALILGLWLMAGVAAGAERGVALRAVPEAELERLGFDAGESSALFVGVSQFSKDETLAPVPYAVDDAVDLAHLFALDLGLVSPGQGRVALALSGEPAKAESRERLAALKAAGARIKSADRSDILGLLERQSGLAGARGLFLVGFATHGFTDKGEDYLLARDSLLGYPNDTAVPKRWLLDALAEAKTQRRFALLDACRERFRQGERGGGAAAMSPSFHEALARAQGTVVLAATTTGGFAFDDPERQNGVFSAAILDGLHGGAPKTEEHHVTAGTLADYVDQQVRAWVSEKRPLSVSSPGITRTIEGAGAELPLAHDPTAEDQARLREYVDRRAAALERLRGNLGGPLTGTLYDRIVTYLDTDSPGDEQRELLEQIEELDGSERSKKALAAYVRYVVDRPAQVQTQTLPPAEPVAPAPAEPAWQEPAPPPPEPGPRVLEPALTAAQRQEVQRALNALGFDAGPADGVFGPRTLEALAAYQRDAGLPVTGYLTGVQHRRLVAAFREREPRVPAVAPAAGAIWTEPETGMELVWVPAGCYQMGSEEGETDEQPVHQVCVDGLWLGKYEVTQGQWRRVMGTNPSRFQKSDDHPVEQVSWEDARAFIAKLNARGEGGLRLPSESEWEYACRGGGRSETYCGGEDIDRLAWHSGNSDGSTHAVGGKAANALGLHDMSGNVWEWVQDCRQDSYAGAPADGSAREQGDCARRVVRGGGWGVNPWWLRSAFRNWDFPVVVDDFQGFRLARTP